MKSNKKLLLTLLLGSLASAASIAQAARLSAEEIYNNLSVELTVELRTEGGPLLGTSARQKNNPSGRPSFCRRTNPVVPNPVYSYACFYPTRTGAEAEALYSGSNAPELAATFRSAASGEIVVGSSWKEKNLGSAEAAICVKTEPVVPNPAATYTCYSTSGGIGGAVSGGN